jgi:FkbM family methyltransferase
MANARWKKIEKSRGFRRAKLLLKRLAGKEPWLRPDISVRMETYDCWTLCPDLLAKGQVVYSLGVGDTVDFDLQLISAREVEVHAFDPTPHALDWMADQETPPLFHFHPWAAASEDGRLCLYPRIKGDGTKSEVMYTIMGQGQANGDAVEVPALTVGTMMARLGHESLALLKMDIEGAEYGVLSQMLATPLRPSQLLVEFHHRFRDIDRQQTVDAISALSEAGYALAHIAATGREFSFIQRSAIE